jgi:MFS family permease
MRQALRGLPPTVWLIGFISLVNDSASELVYPLVPLLLTGTLSSGPAVLGILEGFAEALGSLLKLYSGVLTDRTARTKPWIVGGYALAGAARPLLAFAAGWESVLAVRFLDRVGKGVRTSPRDALLAAAAPSDRRGLAFGLHRAMDNAGAVIGPLAAWALLSSGLGIRTVLLWAFVPGAACVMMALLLKEPGSSERPAPKSPNLGRWSALPSSLRRYLCVVSLFSLGNSSNMFLLMHAAKRGVPASQVPLLWGLTSLTATLFTTHLSALSDRVGRRRLLLGGYSTYVGFYLTMGTAPLSRGWMWPLFAVYGLFPAATEAVEKALTADLAPADQRGSAFGWFNMLSGIMVLPASAIFGGLYQYVSPGAAFVFSGACAAAAAGLLICAVPRSREHNPA